MTDFEFKPYGKTQRYKDQTVTITEKLDGTNACVVIQGGVVVGAQSRNRKIAVGDDNMGFAAFVETNKEDLASLGDGYHYGEWAGEGIQKNPHKLTGKHFFLFNTFRTEDTLPKCVKNVPVLFQGEFSGDYQLNSIMDELLQEAKAAGYTPEGIIVYFHGFRTTVKYTYAGNKSKWELS
tara:strand:- start:70 stop:606 length:537 start_codon:yes stop_codon:yes gene_type:complete